jgi:hypothetical protein
MKQSEDSKKGRQQRSIALFRAMLANESRHRIAALWREGMNVKGRGWAARGARGR